MIQICGSSGKSSPQISKVQITPPPPLFPIIKLNIISFIYIYADQQKTTKRITTFKNFRQKEKKLEKAFIVVEVNIFV